MTSEFKLAYLPCISQVHTQPPSLEIFSSLLWQTFPILVRVISNIIHYIIVYLNMFFSMKMFSFSTCVYEFTPGQIALMHKRISENYPHSCKGVAACKAVLRGKVSTCYLVQGWKVGYQHVIRFRTARYGINMLLNSVNPIYINRGQYM